MNIKNLFHDDDAVSPVIGVILMVAITVILAAVIASFVLGLGNSADEVQPNTTLSFDYESGSPDTVQMTLTDGDTLTLGEVYLRGSGMGSSGNTDEIHLGPSTAGVSEVSSTSGGLPNPGSLDATTEWDPGQSITIEVGSGSYEFDVVWETSEDSATLESTEGPDA